MKMRSLGLVWILFAGCLHGAEVLPGSYMEPAKTVGWWKVGETVRYKLAGSPLSESVTAIKGIVTDAAEKEVTTVSVSREDLEKGWAWVPAEPGYYEVEFIAENKGGSTAPLERVYRQQAPNGASREFHRSKQGFAVLPNKAFPNQSAHQFGFGTYTSNAEDLLLGKLVGFDLVRITAHWGPDGCGMVPSEVIESEKGTYNWSGFDRLVKMYSESGFSIFAQLIGTPYWASPHPEKAKKINICVDEATAYAPVDIADWSRFTEAISTRYRDRISNWEIWNEPAVPGGSCFWMDTPENYFKLLQAGHDAIKKVQPESRVWFGGCASTGVYFAFYDKVLSLGGGKYYDGLSMHGRWASQNDVWRDIEKRRKVDPKPGFNTEWHAILQGNMQSDPVMSEKALSFRMMRDLMFQVKQGMAATILFELKNLTEKEAILFAVENKWFTHSAGIFRSFPQVEPRLPAVILGNFLLWSGRKATFEKEFQLAEDAVALSLATQNGSGLVFWSEKKPLPMSKLKSLASPNSVLIDWEGKVRDLSSKQELEAGKIYYLSMPESTAIAGMASTNKLISPRMAERLSRAVPVAQVFKGQLFDTTESVLHVPDALWIKNNWQRTTLIGGRANSQLTAQVAAGLTPQGLDLVVEVKDSVHVQKESSEFWNGDSVQIAIDCANSGLQGGNTEFVAALTEKGPVVWKLSAAEPEGNIPVRWSSSNSIAKFVESHITREGETTRYQLRIPYSELYPLTYEAARPLHLAVVVNNNDGNGRAEYLEWAGGIAHSKDPSFYGTLNLSPEAAGK